MPEGREKGWLREPTGTTVDDSGQEIRAYTDHPVWARRSQRTGDEGLRGIGFVASEFARFSVPRQSSINGVDETWLYRDYLQRDYLIVSSEPTTNRRKNWILHCERSKGTR